MELHPPIEPYVAAQMEWLGSGMWWDGFMGVSPDVVLCWDTKPYWRQEYLLRDEVWRNITPTKRRVKQPPKPIHYKGGRGIPPVILNIVKAHMQLRAEANGWHQLKRQATENYGYEADDLAALVVSVNRAMGCPRNIRLLTRDKDWMGLIGTETTWLCSNCDNPRVRDLSNYAQCFRSTFEHPTDIWIHKSQHGDLSDNIPNCSSDPLSAALLLPVISLFDPPPEYNLMLQRDIVTEVQKVLSTNTPECIRGNKAINTLKRYGLYPCVPRII